MKTKTKFAGAPSIVVLSIVCMLLFAVVSCEASKDASNGNGDNNTEQLSLRGTSWRLVGIVDAKTGILRELELKIRESCEKCFTLTFETESHSFTAFSIVNEWFGDYMANYETGSIAITNFMGDRALDPFDGRLFSIALRYAQSFVITTKGKLKLYSLVPIDSFLPYRDIINNSYLLFNLQQQ